MANENQPPSNPTERQATPPPSTQATPSGPDPVYARFTALLTRLHAHPVAVHTPNGVLPVAAAFIAAGAVLGNGTLILAGWYNLIFVALTMPVVLYTGYVDWQNRYRAAMTRVFRGKIIAGIATTVIAFLVAPLPVAWPGLIAPDHPARFFFLLLAGVIIGPALYAGYLGGKLVFPPVKKK